MVHEVVERNVENGERWALKAAAKISRQMCCTGGGKLARSSSAHDSRNADSRRHDQRDGQRESESCWGALGASAGEGTSNWSLSTTARASRREERSSDRLQDRESGTGLV
jgi:hypothetical protein